MVARLTFTIGEGEPRSLAPSVVCPLLPAPRFLSRSLRFSRRSRCAFSLARARALHASAFTPRASPPACVSTGVTHRTRGRRAHTHARMNASSLLASLPSRPAFIRRRPGDDRLPLGRDFRARISRARETPPFDYFRESVRPNDLATTSIHCRSDE